MKNILTFALALSLFGSITVLADGDQGNSTRDQNCKDPDNCPPAVCTEGCTLPPLANMSTGDDLTLMGYVEELYIDMTKETFEIVLY